MSTTTYDDRDSQLRALNLIMTPAEVTTNEIGKVLRSRRDKVYLAYDYQDVMREAY